MTNVTDPTNVTETASTTDRLYRARRGRVDIVDVPQMWYLVVDGQGEPASEEYAAAIQVIFTVGYGAHFVVKKTVGEAPRVMPLEGLWWVDDPEQRDLFTDVALGRAEIRDTDRSLWRWRALMAQLPPIDEAAVSQAVERAREKGLHAVDRLRFEPWREGLCAQTLHVGPYAEEGPTIRLLHEGIAAAGYQPRGRHHEIYIGDPRRSAPEKLRTIIRHPVEPTGD
jgi:hypothetical protein